MLPAQVVAVPLMLPGAAGAVPMLIASVEAVDAPQEVFAVTEMLPPVLFGVTEILFVVLLPVQPVGSTQVYDVAPPTGVME